MRSTHSDRRPGRGALTLLATLVAAATFWASPLAAQNLAQAIGSEFSVSRNEAALQLELADRRKVQIALRDNEVFVDGTSIGAAPRGGELDRSWRELLTRAMDLPTDQLPQLLASWEPPSGDVASRLTASIEQIFAGAAALVSADAVEATAAQDVVPLSDSVTRLVDKIGDLERTVAELESTAVERQRVVQRRSFRRNPVHHITEGIAGIFSAMITYVVLFGVGFLVIMFGGRKYIEGVADTARRSPGRSLLVGMAATFLVVPAFFLGCLALIISIVGIPAVLLWIPAFPLAVAGAVVLGYLSVAHAAGEAFAERRFYVTDWFQRGNSYYFLLSGLGLLFVFFLASQVVHMAGPWLGFIEGLLIFFGVVTTVVSLAIGFGAVLISRAGSRPIRRDTAMDEQDLFSEEEAGV